MNDFSQGWYVIGQACRLFAGVAIIYGGYLLSKKYIWGAPKKYNENFPPSQEQRDAMARSYGTEESKQIMKDNMTKRTKKTIVFLSLGIILTFIIPPLGLGLMVYAITSVSRASKEDVAMGRDEDTLYRVNFLEPAFNKSFPEGWKLDKKAYLSDDNVLSALPEKRSGTLYDFLQGKNRFSFTYHGIPMTISHNRCYWANGTDDNGNTNYKEIWSGQVYETVYKTRLSGYVRIVPTVRHLGRESDGTYLKQLKDREVKVETDNIFFNEHFDVFATSQQDALFVLNPMVINYFNDYLNAGGSMSLFVSGSCLVITQKGVRYDVFDTPRDFKKIDMLSVEGQCRKVSQIADNCLGLLAEINGRQAV